MKAVALALFVVFCVIAVSGQIIPDEYIVKFRDNTQNQIRKSHIANVTAKAGEHIQFHAHWEIAHFSGYHATIKNPHVISHIRSLPEVEVVEHNAKVHKVQDDCNDQPTNRGLWGLNRISRATILENAPYIYNPNEGDGVLSYVIDTGIYIAHSDFGGRAIWGANFITGSANTDENGHGTHVAGTIGGTQYGVAKKCTLVAVKVLDKNGSGTLAGVINGLNWVAAQKKSNGQLSTANLSLGASYSATVNSATDALVASGVFTAVAAGNSNADTCNFSPASAPLACSVGATSFSDIRAYFSNWGKCVDIMAPGVDILSAWIGSPTATLTISGTSMASPHVAGVATSILSLNKDLAPLQIQDWIITNANRVNLGDLRGSPDYFF